MKKSGLGFLNFQGWLDTAILSLYTFENVFAYICQECFAVNKVLNIKRHCETCHDP